eukprot:scaffold125670_cov75-Phaeocystis_antarctica.AAC.2
MLARSRHASAEQSRRGRPRSTPEARQRCRPAIDEECIAARVDAAPALGHAGAGSGDACSGARFLIVVLPIKLMIRVVCKRNASAQRAPEGLRVPAARQERLLPSRAGA